MGALKFIFYWPWLGLLLPLPLLIGRLIPPSKRPPIEAASELLFPVLERLKRAFPTFRASTKRFHFGFLALLWLTWVSLVLALMRPQIVDQYTYVKNEGYDLMLAVDISGSMRALDFSTPLKAVSRLDVTKDVVGKFVRARQGDRVGLILFGEHPYLHVPLTGDTLSVSLMLNNAEIGMAGDSTSIGDALGLAVKNLRERPEGSRIVILLTDGEDTASAIPPLEAAKLAKQYGIRIYSIGIGKDGPAPYPDDLRGIVMAELPMDEELLKDLAEETKGKYFRATDADALEKVYERIDALEKTESETREYQIRQPLYRYPLGAASLFLMALCLLPFYRRVNHAL